ncbi:phosphatase PAP2 family protein [Candidatus Gottesmanbacteria bacterium]|nr:phosphatase PAP2 family protein [Candidatus Gottesmanbacteria bacterium]
MFRRIPRFQILCFIASIFLLMFFYGYSRGVKGGLGKGLDLTMTVKLQERIDKSSRLRLAESVGNIMEGSTFFASPEVSTVVVIILGLSALVDLKKKKIRWGALLIYLAFFLLVLGEIYGKSVVHHPSPPFYMIKNPTTVFPKNYINEQFSYPSGHTARAIFMSLVFLAVFSIPFGFARGEQYSVFKNKTRWFILALLCVAYMMLVAVSRIYLGHHWFSDVLGGLLLGSGFGLLALAFILPDPYNTKYMNS